MFTRSTITMKYLFPLLLYGFGTCLQAGSLQQAIASDDLSTNSVIRDSLLASSIISEVLDDFEPSYYIDLTYPKDEVLLGNEIKVKHVSNRPTFTIHSIAPVAQLGKTYTLILTDPDATSRENPKWSEMCHWIVTNLTTPLLDSPPDTAKAGELVEYLPPSPPPKTGSHRYVFVLLEGDAEDLEAPKERKHWGYDKIRHGVRDWAEDNRLTVVGANFFSAHNKEQ